jgi:hypothetical protein
MSNSSLKSKKFFAYLISEIGWKILIFYVVWEYGKQINHYAFMVLITMIVTSGFIQIGYIIGQAALDKYTHIATTALTKDDTPPPKKTSKKREESPLGSDINDFDGTL